MKDFDFGSVTADDLEDLAALRILAMRESLERIGRFDPERARARLLDGIQLANTRIIVVNDKRVGFIVVRRDHAEINLDHFYILPRCQRRGIGSAVMTAVLADADTEGLPIKVGALRGSDANAFYRRFGFLPAGESEWDLYYRRPPALPALPAGSSLP